MIKCTTQIWSVYEILFIILPSFRTINVVVWRENKIKYYHHLENGMDEKLEYATPEEAEQAARGYHHLYAGIGNRGIFAGRWVYF